MFDDGPAIYAVGLVARSSSAAMALATHGGGLVSREGFVAQTVRNMSVVSLFGTFLSLFVAFTSTFRRRSIACQT